jgi:YggT family protein
MFMVLDIIQFLLHIATWIIIIQAVLSWLFAFNVINAHNDFVRQFAYALNRMTEPMYRPIRRIMPDFGALDFSPLVVLLLIQIVSGIIIPHIEASMSPALVGA